MADLDDELLALAGDSSEEEASPPPQAEFKSASPQPPPSSSHKQPSPAASSEMARKGTAKVVRRHKKTKNEDAEEGELSSAVSQQSVSMSESDSDEAQPQVAGDGPMFPYEKLYYSAQDKEEIMAMPEIKREEILSERAQQVDRHNQDLALRRLLASRTREQIRSDKKSKRTASIADLEDVQRKSTRQKTTLGGRKVGETSDAIEAYKRQREQKGKRDELRRRDTLVRKTSRRSESPDGAYFDADAEGESEAEHDNKVDRSPPAPKDDPVIDLKDLQRVRVGRSNFAQVCFYPGFEATISGCFVRVSIGPNRETGQNEYRVCLIKKFTQGRPYAMEGTNGRSFATNQYAFVAYGKAERDFPFIACSDSPFTEAEFNRWRQTMAMEDCKMPSKKTLAAKVADINGLINYQFTKGELNEKLRKQGSLNSKMQTWKRLELDKELKQAVADGDDDAVARLQAELAETTGPKLAFGTSLYKPRADQQTQQQRLAEINLRNQKLNTENVRRAQLEERKMNRKNAEAIARGEATSDPFARVKTRAKIHHDVSPANRTRSSNANGASSTVSPVPGSESPGKVDTPTRSQTPTTGSQSKPKGIAVIRHRNMDDENIAALDIDIDIDI